MGSSDVTKPTLFLWAGEFGRRGWLAGSSQAQPSCFLLCLSWQRVGIQGCSTAAAGMAACRLHQGHAASQLNAPGDAWLSPQALSALVVWFIPPCVNV